MTPCEKFHKMRLRGRGEVRTLPATVPSMLFSVLFSALAFGLAGCRPHVTNRNIDALNRLYETAEKSGKSISIKEVESVLGHPVKVESFPIEMKTTKELPVVRYYYKQDGQTVELHFIENKLIRRVQHFGATPEPESETRKMPPRLTQ
jgi:hypothetical protein